MTLVLVAIHGKSTLDPNSIQAPSRRCGGAGASHLSVVVGEGAEGLVVHSHVILFSHGSQYGTLNLETQ